MMVITYNKKTSHPGPIYSPELVALIIIVMMLSCW